VPLAGPGAWLATLACTLPVLFGFVLPVLMLSHMHLEEGDPMLGTRFTALAMNSFLLAAIAAGLVTAVGLVVAYARRLSSDWRVAATMAVATTGYAVPGTVIAVGVLVPLGALDLAIDGLLRSLTGMSSGLMLSGSIAAVLFAYLVRFLALATGAIESGFAKIPPSMDHVARSLGCTAREVVRRVHVPLLRRSMLTAAVLVFVDVLKELPATLIVRPFNFDTLAVRVYQLASDERLGQASTGALVIVAIGLVPVLILTKLIGTGSNGDSSNVRRRR
jgi:iron(III) transport system permease protein